MLINHTGWVMLSLELLFTYVVSSLCIFLLMAQTLKFEQELSADYFMYSLGLGPVILSSLTALFLWLIPYKQDSFYILASVVSFLLLGLIGIRKISYLLFAFNKLKIAIYRQLYKPDFFILTIIFLIMIVLITLILFACMLPMSGNDQLEYFSLAKIIYQQKNIALYPLLDLQKQGGLVTGWTHPVGYPVLLVWSYMIQGTDKLAGVARFVSPAYLVYTMLLMLYFLSKEEVLKIGLLSVLLLITVPIYYQSAATHHIDAMRIFTLTLAFFFLRELYVKKSVSYLIWQGYLCGLAMFSHSMGILVLPMVLFLFVLFTPHSIKFKLQGAILLICVSSIIMLPRWYVNFHTYGSLVQDSNAIWEIPSLQFNASINVLRGIYTTTQKWTFGLFRGFLDFRSFYLSYWVLLLGLINLRINKYFLKNIKIKKIFLYFYNDPSLLRLSLAICLMYWGMTVLSLFLGMNAFIKNSRYIATIQPFVAIVGAYCVALFYERTLFLELKA